MEGNFPYHGRYCHSFTVYLKRYLVVFGGEKKYNKSINIRECMSDIWVYDIQKNVWQFIKKVGSGIS